MRWKQKAMAFRVLDKLPFGTSLHFALQRHITKNWPRSAHDVKAIYASAETTLEQFRKHGKTGLSNAVFLELGAGRDLTAPIAMKILGAKRVIALDIDYLARIDLINSSASIVSKLSGIDIPHFESFDDLREFGVDYRAPSLIEDVSETIDAFVSNEVLEHIPANALKDAFGKANSLLSSGGVAIHAIDYSDHYARGGAVSRYNFLQFTNKEWGPFNSNFQYVNRLRHSDYIQIIRNSGLTIVSDDHYSEDIPETIKSNLALDFKKYKADDLAIMRARIVAQKN